MAKEFVKFEVDEDKNYHKMYSDKLVENVAHHYVNNIREFSTTLNSSLEDCESPIEQLLAMALEVEIPFKYFYLFNPKIEMLGYQKNEWITINGENYRADFLIDFVFSFEFKKVTYRLIVECDGFQYHQGNKDQIDKDYKRQNDLLANGYDVMRFTGAMINKNPNKCARDIVRHILTKFETMEKGMK